MPSVSEGLNLTPIEATLSGCPSVICDGAIGEIYANGINCLVAIKDDANDIMLRVKHLMSTPNNSKWYKENMQKVVEQHTWDKVIEKLNKILI